MPTMRRNDRGAVLRRWVIVVAAGAFAVAAVMVAAPGRTPAGTASQRQGSPTRKPEPRSRSSRAQTRKLNSDRSFLSQNGAVLAGMLTALVAAGGLFVTLYKQIAEQARRRSGRWAQQANESAQRALERKREQEAREREREQRDADSLRRLEERFTGSSASSERRARLSRRALLFRCSRSCDRSERYFTVRCA